MLVLRKSYGPWSAGTPVEMVTQPGKTRPEVTVRTIRRVPVAFEHVDTYSDPTATKSIIKKKDHAEFDVPIDDLVERREAPVTVSFAANPLVAAKNRKQRRLENPLVIAKRLVYENSMVS